MITFGNPNEKYIDGSWYDDEYQKGWYGNNYKQHPDWAVEYDRYYIDLIAMHTGITLDTKILDIGCGVGNFINGWKSRGYNNIFGVDISNTAVEMSNNPNIQQASITDLPFGNDEFNMVFSSSFWEHIDETILSKALSEACRVGKMQCHLIGLDAGTDPSHINIKTMEQWINRFWEYRRDEKYIVFEGIDILLDQFPLLIMGSTDVLTRPIREKLYKVNNKIND